MTVRLALLAAAVGLLVPAGAGAASRGLTPYPVPRGGFEIALPTTWVDVTATTPTPDAHGKIPTMAQIAQAATQAGAKKLLVIDPKGGGKVYIDVDVQRIGPVTEATAAKATTAAIRKAIGKKGTITSSKVTLGVGPAYQLHFLYTQPTGTYESDEYIVVRDQVEYLLLFVAPQASWPKVAAAYRQSAESFRLLEAPKLGQVVLSGRQVGAGYKSSVIPQGNSFIGETTLDLCAGTFPSESLRTGRLQMRYLRSGKTVAVSNEVVTYVTGGADEALREVRSVAQACASKPVVVRRGALENTLSVTPLKDPKLLPGSVAVRIRVVETNGKKTATSTGVAIYQVKNNTLSGVYAWTTATASLAQATRVGLHAAEQSARNLGGHQSGLTA